MSSLHLLQACLVLHITGLAMMAGTVVANFAAYTTFYRHYAKDKPKALIALQTISSFPRIIGIGIGLLILSGVGMMALTHGIFGEQLWMRIKICLVVLVIVNGVFVARRLGTKLLKLLNSTGDNDSLQIEAIRRRLSLSQIAQLTMFVIIFILSVFKFS